MFDIRICGISESFYFMDQCTKAIGIVNPDANVTPTAKYHVERCHDVSEHISPWVSPRIEQFANILNFSKDFVEDDKVMFHCSAGISRSSATAIMVLIQHGYNEEQAFDACYAVRPHMNPNSLIIAFADDLLGKNGSLREYHKDWLAEKLINPVNFAGQKIQRNDVDMMKDILKRLG